MPTSLTRLLHRVPAMARQAPLWTWAALTLVAGIAVQALPLTELLELHLVDQQFALLRRVAPKSAAPTPVLIGVDEATLDAFPEPVALWHEYLGSVLAALAMARPQAIGLDIELPRRSQDAIKPGLDAALAQGLAAAARAAPLVIARTVDQGGRIRPVHPAFLSLAGSEGSGLATWPRDADDGVRRFDERQGVGGAMVPTLAGVLARRLGHPAPPGMLDFALGAPYAYIPLHQVWDWARAGDQARLDNAFAGRVVLIGGVLPFTDRHRQSVNLAGWESDGGAAPGLLLHAQALRSLLGRGLIRPAPAAAGAALMACAALMWFGFARIGRGVALLAGFAALAGTIALWSLYAGVHLPLAGALMLATAAGTARAGYDAWFQRRERMRLKAAFNGYVSPNVMDLILDGKLESQVGTGRRHLCVLFADIRDFTPLSERTEPERVVALLNRYFDRMTAVIHRHDGTVDNFRGDGIMCIFGAPRATDSPCRDGFAAATGMLGELDGLNADLAADGYAPIAMGVALAYGEAVVGHIGAANRHEYTAIGDVANVSARLEGMTKETGYPLLVTTEVAAAVGADVRFDDLGERALKGHAPVRVCAWPPRAAAAATGMQAVAAAA